MSYKRIGDLIRVVDNRNKDLAVFNLLGLNISNDFMPSIANQSNLDLSKYKVIEHGVFATNIMHVGRDERLPISLFTGKSKALVSPAYKTFRIKDEAQIIPEYLMVEFQRPEFHRLAWFYCDSSVRGGLDWDRFCEIEIPIPSIEGQKKYTSLYGSLMKNQKAFEAGMDDLQVCCETYMQRLVQTEQKQRLGNFIEQLNERNYDLKISKVQGLSISKKFIDSKANLNGVDLSSYKKVKPRQFAYIPVTSRSGDKIAIAMNAGETCIVSSSYITFEVVESSGLIPEFLSIWFSRTEFDRYARFNSWGSARETFDWDSMCSVVIPIPDLEKQKAIVAIEKTIRERTRINEDLKSQIKSICPVLMSGVVKTELQSTQKQ